MNMNSTFASDESTSVLTVEKLNEAIKIVNDMMRQRPTMASKKIITSMFVTEPHGSYKRKQDKRKNNRIKAKTKSRKARWKTKPSKNCFAINGGDTLIVHPAYEMMYRNVT
jgi:hypothetical protein